MSRSDELEQLGNLTVALTAVVEELVRITHRHHPDEVERYLRSTRLLVQKARTDQAGLVSASTLVSTRMTLRLLERALGRDGPREPSAR